MLSILKPCRRDEMNMTQRLLLEITTPNYLILIKAEDMC